MKKVFAGLATLALVSTPAIAAPKGGWKKLHRVAEEPYDSSWHGMLGSLKVANNKKEWKFSVRKEWYSETHGNLSCVGTMHCSVDDADKPSPVWSKFGALMCSVESGRKFIMPPKGWEEFNVEDAEAAVCTAAKTCL